jgi:hypothetical protein
VRTNLGPRLTCAARRQAQYRAEREAAAAGAAAGHAREAELAREVARLEGALQGALRAAHTPPADGFPAGQAAVVISPAAGPSSDAGQAAAARRGSPAASSADGLGMRSPAPLRASR